MAYGIELNITDVDHDKKTLKVQGLKVTFMYLEEIIITPILNTLKPSESVGIMKQLAAAGLRWSIWGAHAQAAQWAINEENERIAKAKLEAQRNAERMAAMNATPEEIRKDNERKEQERRQVVANRKGNNPASYGF